ncbi:MAG: hypothetical protein WCT39_02585 [Candidatus Margulisiibacteriota bacterium]
MPNLTIQRFLYRNLVQRPAVNRTLDRFGRALNKVGLPYATGLTRNKAVLFASSNPVEISMARELLLCSETNRGERAVKAFNRYLRMLPMPIEKMVGIEDIIREVQKRSPQAPQQSIEAAIAARLSPEQIFNFFGQIDEKCALNTASVFTSLPAALDKAKKIFTPAKIYTLFSQIVEKCGENAGEAFRALSAALDKAEKIFTPAQIYTFFSQIIEKCGEDAGGAFRALPAALNAGLSPDQILTLFGQIIDKCGPRAHFVFGTLPNTLDKVNGILTPDQLVALLNNKIVLGWDTPQAKKEAFRLLNRYLGVSDKLLGLVTAFNLEVELTFMLNDPKINPAYVKHILEMARKTVSDSWVKVLNGRPPEELPRVFEFCARVMAEKAVFALNKINTIAAQSRKPTFTVYILSTAYKLKIEQLSDQFREQGLSKREIATFTRAFHREMMIKVKSGMSRLGARMAVGQEWLAKGLLTRFTQPVFVKVPSGSDPSEEATKRLQKLAGLAKKNNYDIVFIDHSTVRTQEVIHAGDPTDFEKGRAIGRALDIVDPAGKMRKWLYKPNNWDIPQVNADRPNMIGLNLYDGQIYESHVGRDKSDWLPVDDHGEFVGVSWDAKGNKKRTRYLVITQNGDGKYHVYTAEQIFNRQLNKAVAELRKKQE